MNDQNLTVAIAFAEEWVKRAKEFRKHPRANAAEKELKDGALGLAVAALRVLSK
jgi:hypothetical protein